MTKRRLQLAVARHTLASALGRPIPLAYKLDAIKPRHLLRALLRQSVYLPDAEARSYFYNHIIGRYRKYHPRPPRPPNTPTLTPTRRRSLLKEARKGLVYLKRANDGYYDHLLRVLAMAYGRIGKKRHELLKTVVSPLNIKSDHSPADEHELARLSVSIEEYYTSSKPRHAANSHHPNLLPGLEKPRASEGPVLGPRLEALVKSQRKQPASHFWKSPVGNTEPSIPEKNSWGRPMPAKRILNMKERWYAKILDKVMPPLPESDWNRLRDLALGRVPWEGPIKRRTCVAQSKGEDTKSNIDQDQPADISDITPLVGGSSVSENYEIFEKENRKLLRNSPHTLTPRYMRRLWGKIFLQCPMMEWDIIGHRWRVKWGSLQRSKEVILDQSGRINMDMFKGVDEDGNVVSLGRASS